MLDARNIYRKVSRAIFDFSPEQQKNIAAIVWLYRGQSERFLSLVESYLAQAVADGQATAGPLLAFEEALGKQIDLAGPFANEARDPDPLAETWEELTSSQATLSADIEAFAAEVAAWAADWEQKRGRRHAGQCYAACGARRPARHGRTLPGPDQADRSGGEAGRAGVDIAVKRTRRTGIGPLGQYGHQQGAQGD